MPSACACLTMSSIQEVRASTSAQAHAAPMTPSSTSSSAVYCCDMHHEHVPQKGSSHSQLIMPYAPMMSSTANCTDRHRVPCRVFYSDVEVHQNVLSQSQLRTLYKRFIRGTLKRCFLHKPTVGVRRLDSGTTYTSICHSSSGHAVPGRHEVISHHGCDEVSIMVGLFQVHIERPLA